MSESTEQIKDRLSITEVVGSYIKLEKAGKNLKACCPFHNEKTASFFISPERDSFYCFGCGKKGDIFSFVQEYEGIDFLSALKLLADKAGVEIRFEKNKDPQKSQKDGDKKILEQGALFYELELQKNQAAQTYLKDRGIDESAIKRWRIGLASDGWSHVHEYFKSLGKNDTELERIGLIKKGEKGSYYDRFRDRIMFPIADAFGNVIGFTGRLFGDTTDDKQAKYLNSPDTPLFNKSKILYGYHLAKGAIRKHDFAILVEGQFDVIAAHSMGYTNTVATSGTALTEQQIDLLHRLSSRLVLALDADGAGIKASERAWQLALAKGVDVKIARLPVGKDPADLALEDQNTWKKVIREAKHIIDFLIDDISDQKLDGRKLAIAIHQVLIPYVAKLESAVEQAHFVERIYKQFHVDRNAIWKEIASSGQKTENSFQKSEIRDPKSENRSQLSIERQLFGILFWKKDEGLEAAVKKIIGEEEFSKHEQQFSEDKDSILFIIEEMYADETVLKKATEELLIRLERSVLEKERATLKQLLEKEGITKEEEKQILEQLSEIAKRGELLR